MNCTDFEIRDYFLGELPEDDRERTSRHVSSCSGCKIELESLRHLRFALESLPDQEPPQRIGFVSDKVFVLSRPRRVWNAFWNSAPRLGFASAAMVSAALVIFSLRPTPVRFVERPAGVAIPAAAPVNLVPMIDEAVRKAVADAEARQQKRTGFLLAELEHKHQLQQRALLENVSGYFTIPQKRVMVTRASSMSYGGNAQ